jgi:hypothetical protein
VFKLGNEVIKEKSYKHLGLETDKTLNTKILIFDAGNKFAALCLTFIIMA